MKTTVKFLPALLTAVLFVTPAFAQQSARRNSTATSRQENKTERQQTRVDKVQKPTNITNQNNTDQKVRESWSSTSGAGGGARQPANNGKNNGNANHGSANRPPVNNGNNNGYVNNGSSRPGGHQPQVNTNRPPVNNGGYNNGGSGRPAPPPGGYGMENARRPKMPPVHEYTRPQIYERTNAASIVVNTLFLTKMEAYEYIAMLLEDRYYDIGSYGSGYGWLMSDIAFIPTPFDWTNPMTHNQFRMRFNISKTCGGVIRVTLTAEWRESVLSTGFSRLRFQPSSSYSTYYAWNVLEEFAENIPHSSLYYR